MFRSYFCKLWPRYQGGEYYILKNMQLIDLLVIFYLFGVGIFAATFNSYIMLAHGREWPKWVVLIAAILWPIWAIMLFVKS